MHTQLQQKTFTDWEGYWEVQYSCSSSTTVLHGTAQCRCNNSMLVCSHEASHCDRFRIKNWHHWDSCPECTHMSHIESWVWKPLGYAVPLNWLKILLKQLVTTNLDYQSEVEWLIKTPVLYFAKPYSKSHSLMESLSLDNIGSINLDDYPRAIANKIRRCLPAEILLVIDRGEHMINQPSGVSVTYENKWYDISKLNSRNLHFIINAFLFKFVLTNFH